MTTFPSLTLVVADDVLDDPQTLAEAFERALDARGAAGTLRVASAEDLADAVAAAAGDGDVVVMPPPSEDLVEIMPALPRGRTVIRFDRSNRGSDRSLPVLRHIWGRGTDGVRFAVDAWFFHTTSPATRITYGEDPEQYGELRLPEGDGPFAVAALVHGGYWRSRWELDLMDAMAVDLTARGYATWNIEYRRPDSASWDAMTSDVAAALDILADVDAPLDLTRVVTLGHSAGGQLVVRLAADIARAEDARIVPALSFSLSGALDLVSGDDRWMGNGAMAAALGGPATELRDRYARSSPRDRVPIGLPVATVVGMADDLDLIDVTRAFVTAAREAGDDVVSCEGPGDHFGVIDPQSEIWPRIIEVVTSRVPAS